MSYGIRIEAARRRAGLSQAKLARMLGKNQGAVSGWENDKFKPGLDEIVAISDATNTSLDELMRGTQPPPKPTEEDRVLIEVFHSLGIDLRTAIRALVAEAARTAQLTSDPPELPGKVAKVLAIQDLGPDPGGGQGSDPKAKK